MPSKGSKLRDGERFNPINVKFHKQFLEENPGIDIDFKTFRQIIWNTNKDIADAIAEDETGVKFYAELGNMVVTKYKSSKKQPIDWKNTLLLHKTVPLLNLHSFGNIYHIKWFRIDSRNKGIYSYKFVPYRTLKRKVAQLIKGGKKYFHWQDTDFWSATKLERVFNKFYKSDK